MPAKPVIMSPTRTYSIITRQALELLGKQIRVARKQRKMTEADLATRVGIARSTLQLVEKGHPKVEIGIVLEAAALVGVPLFTPEGTSSLAPELGRLEDRLQLLPKRVRHAAQEIKDDF